MSDAPRDARLITDPHNHQVRRWEVPEVDVPQHVGENSARSGKKNAPRPMTVEELEALQKQAQEESFKQGHAEGLNKGYAEGYAEGLKKGEVAGYAEGETKGHAAGYNAGLQAGADEVKQRTQRLQEEAESLRRVFEHLAPFIESLDAELEQNLVELVVSIAKQVLRRELRMDPGQVVAAVRGAVALLPSTGERRVRVTLHPEDARILREALSLDQMEHPWRLQEDPTYIRGGVLLETDVSRVDATIERRLNSVIAELWGDERQTAKPTGMESTESDSTGAGAPE